MKKIKETSRSESFEKGVFYREDLEAIITTFVSREWNVRISDSEFEFESLDEVVTQKGTRPKTLHIWGGTDNYESASVSFEHGKAWLFWSSLRDGSDVWFDLHRILSENRNWRKLLVRSPIWYILGLVSVVTESLGLTLNPLGSVLPSWVHLVALVLLLLWPISLLYRDSVPTLIIARRHEGGFFRRNRDAIILAVITAVVTAIITYGVTLLNEPKQPETSGDIGVEDASSLGSWFRT